MMHHQKQIQLSKVLRFSWRVTSGATGFYYLDEDDSFQNVLSAVITFQTAYIQGVLLTVFSSIMLEDVEMKRCAEGGTECSTVISVSLSCQHQR